MRKAAKLPLDFTHRIRYNKSRSKTMRRCVGMADEGDSKSLVLITRVGSTPTTGIKKKLPSSSGEFLFYLPAACERVEQHGPDKECSGNANRPHLPDRMVYRSGNGAVHFLCGSFCFLSAASLARADSSVPPYSPPAKGRFCPPYLWPQRLPAFPGMAACFAERSYYTREKNIEILLRPFILLFLTVFTMFFAKKALQMNFKNILYNHKFNFFTQIVSFRFVWGSEVCAFRAASALR